MTDCQCNPEGSNLDSGCNSDGKCTCLSDAIVGDKCDQAAVGHYGFPDVQSNFI